MAPRLQVQPIQFREQVQPAEEVISTYYQPTVKPKSQLYELAGSLRNFSNDIGGYMDRHQKENDEAAFIRGQAEALKANGDDLAAGEAEGIRSGLFPTFQSDQFVNGYKITQGEIIGKQLASKFSGEYAQWDGRNNQDPAAFDTFLGDFIKTNLTTDDPMILKGALPFLSQTATSGYSANQQDRSTALYNSSIDAQVASSSYDIDNYVDQGIASGEGVNYDGLWDVLMNQRSTALAQGVLASDYDDKMLDLIAAKALETGDPALLSLLENNVPGQQYTYATSPAGSAKITSTLNTMQTAQAQRETAIKKAQDEADKKNLGEAQALAINTLIADPTHVFDEEFLTKVEMLDPKFRLDLKAWSAKFSEPEAEDQVRIMELQSGIITGDLGMEDIVEEMGADGIINNPATAAQMMSLLNSTKDNANQPLLTNQTYKDSMAFLQRALTPDAVFGDDVGSAAIAARLDYQQTMQAWWEQNPDASYGEIADYAGQTLARIKGGIDTSQLGQPEYATPNGLVSDGDPIDDQPEVDANGRPQADTGVPDNPLAPTQQEQANEAAAAPSDDPMAVWRGDTAPTLDTLSEEQRKVIEEHARQIGETPENYITMLYGNLRDNLPPATTVDGQPLEGDDVSYRNNNPGNLRFGTFSEANGATGQDDRGFAIFPDTASGLAAQKTLLFVDPRYKDGTLREAINKYAPPVENDTENYIRTVASISGVTPDTKMSDMTPEQQQKVLGAFNRMEGTAQPTAQNVSYQPGKVTATTGPSGRLIVQDDTLNAPNFHNHHTAVKGRANFFSGGRNTIPPGNPATGKWQSANLTPFSITGVGGKKLNLRVYKPAAAAFQGFLADLAATGYPIHNVGSANYRLKRGGKGLSEHSYGTAIDVNGEIVPGETASRNPMSATFKTDLPENISELAAKWGLAWGGDWKGTKDTMHFEYTGIPPFSAPSNTRVAATRPVTKA